MTIKLRKALASEAADCYQCIEDARDFHKELGFVQWGPAYPTLQTITQDISAGRGFVFDDGNGVAGYCSISFEDEPAYAMIDGAWLSDRPHAVVQRMAFSREARGRGLSKSAFVFIKAWCLEHGVSSIRLDTDEKNVVMQHIVAREGFNYCGVIHFNGGPKLAYEWDA